MGTITLGLETYDDYLPVDRPSDLFLEGRRIFRLPPEKMARPPKIVIASGDPVMELPVRSRLLDLRIVKIPRALVIPGKLVVDIDRLAVPIDSFRKLMPRPVDLELDEFLENAKTLPGFVYHASSAHAGFGHFLLEAMSTLWAYDRVRERISFIIVNRHTHNYTPVIDAFDINAKKLRWMRKSKVFICENLILPAQSYILDKWISQQYGTVVAKVKRQALEGHPAGRTEPIYLSRRHAGKRRLDNEAQIETLFTRNGFRIVYPEQHDFAEQIRIFAAASVIAGPVGSGLYNAAFATRGTPRLILAPDQFYTRNDLLLTSLLDVPPTYLFGRSKADNRLDAMTADWDIDPAEVESALAGVLAGVSAATDSNGSTSAPTLPTPG